MRGWQVYSGRVSSLQEKMKKERDADSQSLHSLTSSSSQHSGKALATLSADGKTVALPGDCKSVEQRVMEVVRAAEQLVSPALAAAAPPAAPAAAAGGPAGEHKTTTVIMTKKSVSHPPSSTAATLQGFVTEPESLTFIEKKHHFESMQQQQQGSLAATTETKRFNFLSESELQKMKEEEENKRGVPWRHDSCEDGDEDTEGEDDVDMHSDAPGISNSEVCNTMWEEAIAPTPSVRTVQAERHLQEQWGREVEEEGPTGLLGMQQRAPEAEKRAAWRQTRMKPLEDDAVEAQAVVTRLTEGMEARPLSPIFKAVNINIDDDGLDEEGRARQRRQALDDENSNTLEHPEGESEEDAATEHQIETTTEKILSLELHGTQADGTNDNTD